jgi:hypothetical protein
MDQEPRPGTANARVRTGAVARSPLTCTARAKAGRTPAHQAANAMMPPLRTEKTRALSLRLEPPVLARE